VLTIACDRPKEAIDHVVKAYSVRAAPPEPSGREFVCGDPVATGLGCNPEVDRNLRDRQQPVIDRGGSLGHWPASSARITGNKKDPVVGDRV
jgi:hypothetical protein